MMNLLAEVFENGMAFFFPKKCTRAVDWKTVGQLRARLSSMSIESKELVPVSNGGERNMASAFNVLTRRVTDREGHARWYGRGDGSDSEKALHVQIEAGQRAVMALKQSGQFPAILPEEADALREVHQRFMKPTATNEIKVASFLSGDSDDINDLLFSNLSYASAAHAPSMRYLNCSPDDTVQDIPIITDEILAALEQSAALNSIGSYPADIEPEERFEESRKERQENMQRDGSENAARENEPESEEHEEHGEHEVRKQKVVCMAGARKSAGAARISDSPVTDLVESLSPSNVTLFRPRFRSPS